ncbi:hypothetical protein KFU94_48535 [Chloroflexi bacterium TSY]|nr:hypothetical protein [Chloroflexi bacterium TSY]
MNILDENILKDQRQLLRSWRIRVHQIGQDIGRQGMKDREIIPLLHQYRDATFFSRDRDFHNRSLCHTRYCLVFLNVEKYEVALFVRRILRHPDFNTKAKRRGTVIRLSHTGLSVWRLHAEQEERFEWPT